MTGGGNGLVGMTAGSASGPGFRSRTGGTHRSRAADDQVLVRAGLHALPSAQPDIEVGPRGPDAELTEREREVTALVGMGPSNQEIARRLEAGPLTATTHVSRTMVEPGARDHARLLVLAYTSGLVRPSWFG